MNPYPYLILLKPRVIWLLIFSSTAGYIYAAPSVNWLELASLLLVATLAIGGSAAFNHYWERDIDAVMTRTARRPLPAGLVPPAGALALSLALSAAGIALAFLLLGHLPAIFVLAGWLFYAVVYTIWLKRRSWLNVLVGGFAGNATFLGGYALGRGSVDLVAVLVSFAIYLWIPSHIWALAYRYRHDYIRAGVPMLPVLIRERKSVALVSAMNIVAAAYAVLVYLMLGAGAAGLALVLGGAAASVAASALALARGDDESMWRMYKASSPILTLFLSALIVARLF
ncbi:MAG: heme o synthase [Thermoproteaceae archaeon]|jgi:protoheme IX farnesyltransferase|nr:heme o synthase [Thermoproteaceae archaeon]